MTNLVLTGAKAFGQTLLQTAGRVGVAYAGQALTRALDNRVFEGPRLQTLHIQSSQDGAPMARIYGRARMAGQVIWATRVREHRTEEKRGGKGGGPRTRNYSYTLSFAVGLCEGEILEVGQIWANGQALQIKDLNTRLYKGGEDQAPDPLIAEIEGTAVPAFRGTAYMVFEDMPLEDFGTRLPQLNFEIVRAPKRTDNTPRMEDLVTGVDLIPGSGEFAYGTTITEERLGPGTSRPVNMNNLSGRSDMDAALDQLQSGLPNCTHVTLIISWFGDDLRLAECQLRPGAESRNRIDKPGNWQVGSDTRANAYLISQIDERPVYGGTPSDDTVIEAVQALNARGLSVTLYPFILMDVVGGNTLPNPYGGNSQPVFPWRGRITCTPAAGQPGSVDKTTAATTQVQSFFGATSASDFSVSGGVVSYNGPAEYKYRRMILHYAHLMQVAGGVDAFIIGSEMRGMTTVRGAGNDYPAVSALQTLAADVRSVMGAGTKISYAADWSEYFGHQPGDGSGDVRFHLDPLWADSNIDAVGIDAYFPLSDWRDSADHLDAQNYARIYDEDYLTSNMEGGEGYDWYYASSADRDSQTRTPITDGAYNKPWVYCNKDVKSWWANPHYDRIDGVEQASASPWVPQSKPIWFTEIGCPAIDKGANQPNVFWDPKSSESFAPYYSSAARDDLIQRRYIEIFLGYWQEDNNKNPVSSVYGGPMVDLSRAHIWCWDARPFPDFPARLDVWSDGGNWRTGHWISGRTGLVSLADIVSDISISSGADAPDVNKVLGMVSGYVLDRPMSARAALTPLSRLYGFDLIERADGLSFASRGTQGLFDLVPDNLVFSDGQLSLSLKRTDAESRIKDVRIGFIDQAQDYQSGSAMARDLFTQTERIIDISAPLVLDTGQAKTIAASLLEQVLEENETLDFAIPPSLLGLETGDIIRLDQTDGDWQITALDGLGGRTAQARRIETGAVDISSGGEPGVVGTPSWVSTPEGYGLDIADFTGEGTRTGPLVGVVVNPFAQTVIAGESGQETLTDTYIVIGALLNDLPSGPVGRFDMATQVDVLLPGVLLASLSDQDVLSGGNMLAVETNQGWEILQAANADLVAPNTYRISKLLRGQYGTDHVLGVTVPAGARVVYLSQGWQDHTTSPDLRGSELAFTLETNGREGLENFTLNYKANHLRPLSPVHIKAARVGTNINISWTRRTRIGGDDWAPLDVPLGEDNERYEIDFLDSGGAVVLTRESVTQSLQIPITELETVLGSPLTELSLKVYQMSVSYGRGVGGVFIKNMV
ncbi:MAG: glycoside hydrolase/phage tail family protein [Robiginitomaculum sp.]|nr:glycoside hydrolase/phage tail family protein [Robiginitomaculum sp.]